MKKRVLAVLTVLLAMMIPVWCFAEEENEEILSSGEWEYYLNDDGTATIACWNGDDEEVVVPGEIDGLQVAKIGKEAFHDCSDLTSIEIPETVTAIGEGAILGCISLKSISVSPENKNFAVIDNVLFETESKTLICYPCGLTDIEYAIPEGITEIAKGAFLGSSSLMSIEIPESVTEIGEYAFSYCSSLTSIEIPESVTKIRKDAFSYCSSLRCIKIPESVTEIGEDAFGKCGSLTSIEIPELVTEIGERAFYDCDSLTSIRVSPENKNFAVIDNVLFEKESKTLICYPCGLTDNEYAIPEGITKIGEYAFYSCDSLTSIEIPESVTAIGGLAFSSCNSLTSIEIPESVTYIGEYAFSNCSSLTSIKIPESVTEIGELAFFWCDSLTMLVEKDSYAAQYAKENDIPYTYPDANDWLND